MAYMERLGLWGLGSSFSTFAEFSSDMASRGVGALEMLAVEMKESILLSFGSCFVGVFLCFASHIGQH